MTLTQAIAELEKWRAAGKPIGRDYRAYTLASPVGVEQSFECLAFCGSKAAQGFGATLEGAIVESLAECGLHFCHACGAQVANESRDSQGRPFCFEGKHLGVAYTPGAR